MNCRGRANVNDKEGPCVAETGRVLTPEGNGSHWHHASNQVFISSSAASPNTMRKAGMPGPPSSYLLAQIPWLMGIAGPGLTPSQRGRGMRQEGLCLLRLPPPLQLQTANDNILRGVDPHQRGPWAKKTTWEAWKWGGRAGAHGVEVKLRWCCLWVTSVWLSNMLPYQHCWALKS